MPRRVVDLVTWLVLAVRLRAGPSGGILLVLGLAGSCAVSAGSFLTGRIARTRSALPLVALQRWAPATPLGHLLLFAGIAGLSLAWWRLRRVVQDDPSGLRRVLQAAALWTGPLFIAPPALSGDVWSYVADAALLRRGMSPYVVTPAYLPHTLAMAVSARWRHTLTPYGPVALAWSWLAGRVTTSPWLLMMAFRLLAVMSLAVLAWAVVRIARSIGRNVTTTAWLVVASPFTLLQGVAGAHLDLLVAGLVAAAVVLALEERIVGASVVLGLGAGVKVSALAAIVTVSLALLAGTEARWGARVRTAALVLLGAVGTELGFGAATGLGQGWVVGLDAPLSELSPLSPSTQLGIVLSRLSGHPLVHSVQLAGEVLLLGAAAATLLRGRVDTQAGAVRSGALVLGASVLLSPVVHPWYLLIALPVVACALASTNARRTATSATIGLALLAPLDASQHLASWRWLTRAELVAALMSVPVSRLMQRGLSADHDRSNSSG